MADKPTCPPEQERKAGLFRRAEDWERLTRLEFIVEELARDNDRRDERIERIVETQKKQGEVQDQMLRYARDIRMILLGASGIALLWVIGIPQALKIMFNTLMTGV